jgi:quercetin dioxygenase-like cupin family protein
MKVERWSPEREGPPSEAAMRRKLEGLGYAVHTYTYPTGMRFDEHTHGVDKIDGVVSGRFRIEMEGESVVLQPGDMVWVPRGARHSAEVVGDEPVRSLDAVKR